MDNAYQNLIVGASLALVSAAFGLVVGYLMKLAELSLVSKKEKKKDLEDGLKELHIGCFEFAFALSVFATDVNEFLHGETADVRPLSAVGSFTKSSATILARLSSLQRRYAPEFAVEWVKVRNAVEVLFVTGGQAMINKATLGDLTKTLNRLNAHIETFTRRIESKLEEI